jgi:hypothetical protein
VSDTLAVRLKLTSFVILAVVGTWLGHGIEYARVAGLRGLVDGLAGPLHTYMVPAGAVIAILTFCVASDCALAARGIRQRRRDLQNRLASAFRGRRIALAAAAPPPAIARQLSCRAMLAALASLQLILYLLQENIEAVVAGSTTPGFGAVSGTHWAAPLVHLAVASVLSLVVIAIRRSLTTRLRAIAALVSLLDVLLQRLGASTKLPRPTTAPSGAPAWLTAARVTRGPPEPVGA